MPIVIYTYIYASCTIFSDISFLWRNDRLRIGTFNVNGKMPSQDLSAWIQGTSLSKANQTSETEVKVGDNDSTAPPLASRKNTSPISLGDNNPLKWGMRLLHSPFSLLC